MSQHISFLVLAAGDKTFVGFLVTQIRCGFKTVSSLHPNWMEGFDVNGTAVHTIVTYDKIIVW